jgi:hypothetical protein
MTPEAQMMTIGGLLVGFRFGMLVARQLIGWDRL